MQRILSTYRYVNQILSPALIAEIAQAGIRSIEIFGSPSHFNFRNPKAVRDIADCLGEYQIQLHALHSPTERNQAATRESAIPISISDPERIRRNDAVDEVKRALEVAERIPFRYLVQHIGHGRESADGRKLDAAFNSLEHLGIFAKQRGVVIALENTPSELGSPLTLQQFIADTHLNDLKLCLDLGHAHIEDGISASFEAMRDRIVTLHVHDNHGEKDEHLLPYEGSIDWDAAIEGILATPGISDSPPMVIELKEQSAAVSSHANAPSHASSPSLDQIRSVWDRLEEQLEERR